jgi:hypothetical protein
MEQIQCCFHYPGRGFQIDGIRIVSIDMPDWEAIRARVATASQPKHLAAALSRDFPIVVARDELNVIKLELGSLAQEMGDDFFAYSGLLTLSMFVGQALEQRDAGARFEHWPGEYFETQTFIAPGTDLLQDLVEMNEFTEETRKPSDHAKHQ